MNKSTFYGQNSKYWTRSNSQTLWEQKGNMIPENEYAMILDSLRIATQCIRDGNKMANDIVLKQQLEHALVELEWVVTKVKDTIGTIDVE